MNQVHISTSRLISHGEISARIECSCGDGRTELRARVEDVGVLEQAFCECGLLYKAMMSPKGLAVFRDLSRSTGQK